MAITHIEIIIEQMGGRINGFINSSCFYTVSIDYNNQVKFLLLTGVGDYKMLVTVLTILVTNIHYLYTLAPGINVHQL